MAVRKASELQQRGSSFVERVGLILNGDFRGSMLHMSGVEGIAVEYLPSSIRVFVDTGKYQVEGLAKTPALLASQLEVAEIQCVDEATLHRLLDALKEKNSSEEWRFMPLFTPLEHIKSC